MFAPIFERASEKHDDLVFAKVDTEAQQELAASFNIQSIPTLMIVRDRTVLYAQPGALPEAALEELVQQARDLDMDEVRRQIPDLQGHCPAASETACRPVRAVRGPYRGDPRPHSSWSGRHSPRLSRRAPVTGGVGRGGAPGTPRRERPAARAPGSPRPRRIGGQAAGRSRGRALHSTRPRPR